mgnify:CR=1 FL=1
MRKFAILLVLVFAAAPVHAFEERPPLVIDFIIDASLQARFANGEDLREHINDLVSRASMIFNAGIGRKIAIGELVFATPPGDGETLYVDKTFEWLERQKKALGKNRFLILLTYRFLYKNPSALPWDGGADKANGLAIVVHYSIDVQRISSTLLHEIGHLCGARHSEDKSSIMYENNNDSATPLSFKEYTSLVREQCG